VASATRVLGGSSPPDVRDLGRLYIFVATPASLPRPWATPTRWPRRCVDVDLVGVMNAVGGVDAAPPDGRSIVVTARRAA